MVSYACNYYTTRSGRCYVEEFIDSLDAKTQAKFFSKVSLLERHGQKLPQPHADYLEDGIYELRFTGPKGQIRVLYFFFHGNKIVLTNGFIKKTRKTPRKEIKLAKVRRKDFFERMKER